jgi:hypothetical protein
MNNTLIVSIGILIITIVATLFVFALEKYDEKRMLTDNE